MTRRLSLVLLALLTTCGDDAGSDNGTETSSRAEDGVRAAVAEVLDGDSVRLDLAGGRVEVRLAGVNAPETGECRGSEAEDRLHRLVGDEVTLTVVDGERDRDQFGRLLRDVWAGETWVNRELVAEGLAVVIQTGRTGQEELLAAQDRAWEARLGMWAPGACGPAPDGIRIVDVVHDPPGPDEDAADDELVVIANDGARQLDLSGWILRDESTEHRYRFADGTTLDPDAELEVRSGCGKGASGSLSWCDGPVWSNGGDTALLQTPEGTVVDRWVYRGPQE